MNSKKLLNKRKIIKIRSSENVKDGFALFYVLLIVGVMLIATSIFLETALEELFLSADREESDRALYMAEAGVECALYHQREYNAFITLNDPDTYSCNSSVDFDAGWSDYTDPDLSIENPGDDSCFWGEDPTPIFGLGLDPSDYDGVNKKLYGVEDAIVLKSEDSDACSRVTVEVEPVKNDSLNLILCRITIRSEGASECDSDGNPLDGAVERTRVERVTR